MLQVTFWKNSMVLSSPLKKQRTPKKHTEYHYKYHPIQYFNFLSFSDCINLYLAQMIDFMKKLSLILAACAALALTACDTVDKQALTKKAEDDRPAATASSTNSTSNASSTSQAADGKLALYWATPEQIVRKLDDYRRATTKEILEVIDEGYPSFLEQMADLHYSSAERATVDKFANRFIADMLDNQTHYSINLKFASELSNEAIFFSDSDNQSYPKLTDDKQSYTDYRSALVKAFNESIDNIAARLKDPEQQKVFLKADVNKQVPAAEAIDSVVKDFKQIVTYLTANDLYCKQQKSEAMMKECFNEYLQLVAKLPAELSTVYYLQVSDIKLDEYVSPVTRENIIYSLISYFNAYVKPLQLENFDTK